MQFITLSEVVDSLTSYIDDGDRRFVPIFNLLPVLFRFRMLHVQFGQSAHSSRHHTID